MQLTTQQKQDVAKGNGNDIRNLIESDQFKLQVAKALPRHLTPDRFIRVAVTTMLRTPKLALCNKSSFVNSLLTCSQLGLEPDNRRAYLIPYENKKAGTVECQLQVGYQGLVELVMNNEEVAFIHADVVRENDVFEYDMGQITKHKIDLRKPRGEMYAAYAIVKFKNGQSKCEVMGREEIELVREKSQGWRAHKKFGADTPWSDPQSAPEMWKKTVFKRLAKWVKLSPEVTDVIQKDEEAAKPDVEVPFDIDVTSQPIAESPSTASTGETESVEAPKPVAKVVPLRQPAAAVKHTAIRPTPAPAPEPEPAPQAKTPTDDDIPFDDAQPAKESPEEQPSLTLSPMQQGLADTLTDSGVSLHDFNDWAHTTAECPKNVKYSSWVDVPEALAVKLANNAKTLNHIIKIFGKR